MCGPPFVLLPWNQQDVMVDLANSEKGILRYMGKRGIIDVITKPQREIIILRNFTERR